MRAVIASVLRARPGGRGLTGLGSLLLVFVLVIAVAPTVLASGGDHGACGTDDWVKLDVRGDGFDVEWSRTPFTAEPSVVVTAMKEGEPITISWTHEDTEAPTWVVDDVWLKAGSERSGAGLIGPFDGGTSGTATTVDATPIPKGISFVLFCFEEEPADEPTTEQPTTEEPTTEEPTTEEPTDEPATGQPTEPGPTEPEPTDTEGVLPTETEEPSETPTPAETVTPSETVTPTVEPEVAVLGESTELPRTGVAGLLALLTVGLGTLAGGTLLVRRTR